MPTYRTPGVYVEEVGLRTETITGVDTTTCAFVGPTHAALAPGEPPPLLTSVAEFERHYGDAADLSFEGHATPHYLAHAVRAFFAEGGRRLHVSPVARAVECGGRDRPFEVSDYAHALRALEAVEDIRTVAAPGATEWCDDPAALAQALITHAAQPRMHRFAVLDAPRGAGTESVLDLRRKLESPHAALYYPWVETRGTDATGAPARLLQPPSGFVCGVYARNDVERGVHVAAANQALRSATGFERTITTPQQEQLNPEGVNCLRSFPGRGHRVWGSRTTSSSPEWIYVNVRRYIDYVEASIGRGLDWVSLEENGPSLWVKVRGAIEEFLAREWTKGTLAGTRPDHAWFVRCDAGTMTDADVAGGRVVAIVGLAMLKPAEFILLRVALASRPGRG
ncbi:phage tail sheath family protein [Luteimonas aestuarii]|uniref:Phage tail sheath family protein n=1 Tax=Luteimonas aestuarii TaxID=453837 RepID=A0A4R5TTN3_9GAMM|nr:phage tail sheath subtilisin-like domain-containing protein [Luteimonas aestuarii]TDK24371.1 phage tail sheath family protein [Luteimonas aestuarii]